MSATVRVCAATADDDATADDAANTSSHVPADPPTTNDPSSCAPPVISAAVDPAAGTSTTDDAADPDDATDPPAIDDADNSPSNPPASILSKVESPASYCIRFEGNSSSQWDGKEIFVEKEWLESLYPRTSITKGKEVILPYPGRQGKVKEWKGIVVNLPGRSAPSTKRKSKFQHA